MTTLSCILGILPNDIKRGMDMRRKRKIDIQLIIAAIFAFLVCGASFFIFTYLEYDTSPGYRNYRMTEARLGTDNHPSYLETNDTGSDKEYIETSIPEMWNMMYFFAFIFLVGIWLSSILLFIAEARRKKTGIHRRWYCMIPAILFLVHVLMWVLLFFMEDWNSLHYISKKGTTDLTPSFNYIAIGLNLVMGVWLGINGMRSFHGQDRSNKGHLKKWQRGDEGYR